MSLFAALLLNILLCKVSREFFIPSSILKHWNKGEEEIVFRAEMLSMIDESKCDEENYLTKYFSLLGKVLLNSAQFRRACWSDW